MMIYVRSFYFYVDLSELTAKDEYSIFNLCMNTRI